MKMIAVFLSREAYEDVRAKVKGDMNEQNVKNAIKKMYASDLKNIADIKLSSYRGFEFDNDFGGVFACVVNDSKDPFLGRAVAASLGFQHDYMREGSWCGVLFI